MKRRRCHSIAFLFCGVNYGLCVVVLYCPRRPYSFCACKKNMERKTGQRGGEESPLFGNTPQCGEGNGIVPHNQSRNLSVLPSFSAQDAAAFWRLLGATQIAPRTAPHLVNVSEIFFRSRRRCEASRRTIAACRRPPIKAKRSFYPFGGQGVATPGRPLVTFRRYGKLPAGGN